MIRCCRLDTPSQSLVVGTRDGCIAEAIYWGAPLPVDEDLTTLVEASFMGVASAMLDKLPGLSFLPEESKSFPGQPGILLRAADGAALSTDFRLSELKSTNNQIIVKYHDDKAAISYQAEITADSYSNIITLQASLKSHQPILVHWLAAPVLPAPQFSDELIDVSGRWCREFQLNYVPWSPGVHLRESRLGRSSHEHFPALIIPCRGAANTQGAAYGFQYGWSGGHAMIAEELPDGRRQIQFGHSRQSDDKPVYSAATAKLYVTYNEAGLNSIGHAFHRHLKSRILNKPRSSCPLPVHYNCWEAIYFDHDIDTLKVIATQAADLGAERFVLDDGWFKGRDDDMSSLGDWIVDERKFPSGLAPLIDYINSLGMSFGLWFEPEMVNPDSNLYRQHPDWILGPADQIQGRNQLVLNLDLALVRDYLFRHITTLLDKNNITYIKWDHNRVLPRPSALQTQGCYSLIDQLRLAFPAVVIESCASGGGRCDLGMLERTHRVWLSDSNDALERWKIQHNAALFLAPEIMGSHVGPAQCHTSGRMLSMSFRAWVAASRHMGFELDPRELTADEINTLKYVTKWWKTNRGWLFNAQLSRLDSIDPSVIGEVHISQAQDRFIVFVAKVDTSLQALPRPLRLTGLDGNVQYCVSLINKDDLNSQSRNITYLSNQNLTVSGNYLMQQGLQLPDTFPATMWVLEGIKMI